MKVVICPTCQAENRGSKLTCEKCGGNLSSIERIEKPDTYIDDLPTSEELFSPRPSNTKVANQDADKKSDQLRMLAGPAFLFIVAVAYTVFFIAHASQTIWLGYLAGVLAGIGFTLWRLKYRHLPSAGEEGRFSPSSLPLSLAIPLGIFLLIVYWAVEYLMKWIFGEEYLNQILDIILAFTSGLLIIQSGASILQILLGNRMNSC